MKRGMLTTLLGLVLAALMVSSAHAGHITVSGVYGMMPYPNTGNFTAHAGCTLDTTTLAPLTSYQCTTGAGASAQGVLIQFGWFDATATNGNVKFTVHMASKGADSNTALWQGKVACDNGAYSIANPTFGTASASVTCTDLSPTGKEVVCTNATAITPASTSSLGGANTQWTCLLDLYRYTGGSIADGTFVSLTGYEVDMQ